MDTKQIKLMARLAKKLREEKRDKKAILNSFVSAGILTNSGNYTKKYASLGKLDRIAS